MKQELRYRPTVRLQETHSFPDTAIRSLPLLRLVIEKIQPPELVLEKLTDFLEPGRWPELGVEPGEISACHHKFGKQFVAADKLPHAVGFSHGTDRAMRPIGGMTGSFKLCNDAQTPTHGLITFSRPWQH